MLKRTTQRKQADRSGFTLIEALIASFIVGVGVSAIMVATKSNTRVNANAREITNAINLSQEIREWTLKLPFVDPETPDNPPGPDGAEDPQTVGNIDDLDDLMGVTYSPPRDGTGQALSDMTGWSQQITLTWRNPDNLSEILTDGASEMIYVEVMVSSGSQPVLTTGWLVTKRN
ncbi:MAG: prepilin-type N-terminal cleavage/methylation domain-containing protein [Planctomycetota bacterium]|nr:prepilin-type N-terminal cleavage/methylation domain-containing protein [Planctomycetota bacterium]